MILLAFAFSPGLCASLPLALPGSGGQQTYSINSSSISLSIERNFTAFSAGPVNLSIKGGHNSANPLSAMPVGVGGGGSSRTELSNSGRAASMSHEVTSTGGLSASESYSATSTGSGNDLAFSGISSTQMQIDESVTGGHVSIGVISGDAQSGTGRGGGWKSPSIEIEEEYVGDVHISNSFTINQSTSGQNLTWNAWDELLYDCCAGYAMRPKRSIAFDADDVFGA